MPHQPHYQTLDYNPLNGGIARWFEPIEPAVGDGADACARSSRSASALFGSLAPATDALARRGAPVPHRGAAPASRAPTPEGLHRDGVDYVLVLLVNRRNIAQRHDQRFTASTGARSAASR